MSKLPIITKYPPLEEMKLVVKKVERLNADGSATDITDSPELWFPAPPTDPKEIMKIKLWKAINDQLHFFNIEKKKP